MYFAPLDEQSQREHHVLLRTGITNKAVALLQLQHHISDIGEPGERAK